MPDIDIAVGISLLSGIGFKLIQPQIGDIYINLYVQVHGGHFEFRLQFSSAVITVMSVISGQL